MDKTSNMRVAAEFKRLVKEKAEKDGKEMTVITEELAKKMRKIL